ncbi:MAG TPA: 1,4-dihydroxy-2-naphthoate octaprenyltransferase [Flavobacteriales bacterium]
MALKNWIAAARLRTLPLAASCTLTGSALAWQEDKGNWKIFGFALLTTFLLQILSNFANDYGDFTKGVDNAERVGPQRALQSGSITQEQMKNALLVCALLTLLSGLILLWVSLAAAGLFLYALVMLGFGLLAILAAFRYTMGKNPYGYRGLGDVFVFLFFGLVGVCGTYFLYTHTWNSWTLLPAVTIGLLSAAVLNLNNLRDHVNDAASGKRTLVVVIGFEKGKYYQLMLVVMAFVSALVWMVAHNYHPVQWTAMLPLGIPLLLLPKLFATRNPALLDADLKKIALSAFLFSVFFFIVWFL